MSLLAAYLGTASEMFLYAYFICCLLRMCNFVKVRVIILLYLEHLFVSYLPHYTCIMVTMSFFPNEL